MISEGGERGREKDELGGRLREGGMMEGREGRIIVSCSLRGQIYSATEQESRFFYNFACTLILICNEPN